MRILVTGGTGFVGSHVVLDLLLQKKNVELCIIDNLSNSYENCISDIKNFTKRNIEFKKVDLRNLDLIEKEVCKFKPDLVIHCAGLKSVQDSSLNPLSYYDNNVLGSINLLKSMDKCGCKKLIFSSSATVYGEPQYLPYDENHFTTPVNTYGWTKLIVEKILKDWCEGEGKSSVALRYFNPVGSHETGIIFENAKSGPKNLFPVILRILKEQDGCLSVYGKNYNTIDGTGVRDYIHIMDLSQAHLNAINYVRKNNGFIAMNIGLGVGFSVLNIVEEFEKVSGSKINLKFLPRRKGDIDAYWSECSLANSLLSWKCKYNLNDMCFDTLKSL